MDDGIALKPRFCAEMIHAAVQRLRINPKITDAERFKQQAAGRQVVDEIPRADAQGSGGNGGIDEIAGVRCADRGF